MHHQAHINRGNHIPNLAVATEEDILLTIATHRAAQQGQIRAQNVNNTTRTRAATPWYLSHSLFLAILMVRVIRRSGSRFTWWLTFSPLLLSSGTVLFLKIYDSYAAFTSRNNTTRVLSYRVHCALVDHIGYTLTIVFICLYLETSLIPNIASLCAPLLMTAVMSLVHRLINLPALNSRTIGQLFISSFFNCLVHALTRIIQPLLLVLKLDGYVKMPWTVVAVPIWILCICGVVVTVLLLYFSCVLHAHANAILRVHASKLMLLCAFQLLVISLCGGFATYWLATGLDGHGTIEVRTYLAVFLPLVGMCLTVAICYPITLANSSRYHELLFSSTQMYLSLHAARRVVLEPLEGHAAWLLQPSESLFRLTTLCALGMSPNMEMKLRQQLQPFCELEALDGAGEGSGKEDTNAEGAVDIETGQLNKSLQGTVMEDMEGGGVIALQQMPPSLHLAGVSPDMTSSSEGSCGGITKEQGRESEEEEKEEDDEEDSRISLSTSTSSSTSATLALVDIILDKATTAAPNSGLPTHYSSSRSTVPFSSKSTDEHMCIICYDMPANACFMGCGHGGVCYDCAQKVAKKPPSQCPICRVGIEQVFKLTHYVDVVISSDSYGDEVELSVEEETQKVLPHHCSDIDTHAVILNCNRSGDAGSEVLKNDTSTTRLVLSEEGVNVSSRLYHTHAP